MSNERQNPMAALRRLDRALFGGARQQYRRHLAAASSPTSSALDVGCGIAGVFRELVSEVDSSVGVDIHLPRADIDRSLHAHDQYVELDIRMLGAVFTPNSFETVVALDVIEHLSREDGLRLLSDIETIARRRVVVFTPNGFLPQPSTPENPHQQHHSGWSVEDFESRGYRVLGIHGLKPLRGAYAGIRLRPTVIWERVSLMTQPFALSHPRSAFQLLCIKDVEAIETVRPDVPK